MKQNLRSKLIDPAYIEDILPLVKLLNPETGEHELREHMQHMKQQNYSCMGLYDETKLVGICGMWILHKFYVGKHLEPDNVVIIPEYRNMGAGKILMDAVYHYAQKLNCSACELNVYVQNNAAQEFWMEQGFNVLGLHMQKKF